MHGRLSPDIQSMEYIRKVMKPTDVPESVLPPLLVVVPRLPPDTSQAFCVICFGPIHVKTSQDGQRMTAEISFTFGPDDFHKNVTWI